jgi:sugar phosphate isomerase/epimerase
MKSKPIVALQLWSVNKVIPTDVRGTLRKIAAMGYQGVECAGYYNLSGPEWKAALQETGLTCVGSHVGLALFEGDKFEETVAINRALGTDRLIVPGGDLSDMPKFIDRLNAAHAKAKSVGMRSGFHNHHREFETVNGVTKLDMIFAATPQDFLVQIDIGWAAHAHQDLAALLHKYASRIETVHVKESCAADPTAPVGSGDVQWPPLFALLEKEARLQAYVIEHEQHAAGPLESVQACIDGMKRMQRA